METERTTNPERVTAHERTNYAERITMKMTLPENLAYYTEAGGTVNDQIIEILAEYTAPRLLVGDRCQVLVARSRSAPVWVTGRIAHIDRSDPNDVRLDIHADDGRLIPSCRADCVKEAP